MGSGRRRGRFCSVTVAKRETKFSDRSDKRISRSEQLKPSYVLHSESLSLAVAMSEALKKSPPNLEVRTCTLAIDTHPSYHPSLWLV